MKKNIKEIIIAGDTKVRDFQKEFEEFYPFLRIEFFDKGAENFFKSRKVNPDMLINKISNLSGLVKLNMDEKRTIAEVEKDCLELLGISIQIFRKSGNVSVKISITNSWTLQSQNMAGEFISTEMQKVS